MSDASNAPEIPARPRVTHPVRLERSSGVATILIENPPVNALNTAVRRGILAALEAAEADPKTQAVVIAARGRTFPAGADITEFDQKPQEPSLPRLCDRIEACSKPVFAAIHGTTLGGGLELAMACHYRLAAPSTKLGLPEVKLGILPGAGGTQRTPRLAGVENALALIRSGAMISAAKGQEMGLVDAVDEDPREAAMALAATGEMPVRRTRDDRTKLGADDLTLLSAARRALPETPGPQPAMQQIIDCLEAAVLLPFDAGIAREAHAFEECVTSRDSLGLRHVFFAERKVAKFPELQGKKGRPISKVAILGGGRIGSGLALTCLGAGLPVILVEDGEAGVTAALDRIGEGVQSAVAGGAISEADGAQALSKLTLTARRAELEGMPLVVDCTSGPSEERASRLAEIAAIAGGETVFAVQLRDADMDVLTSAIGAPERVVPVTFLPPVEGSRLTEIGVSAQNAPEAVGILHRIVKAFGKIPLRATARNGMILERIRARYHHVVDAMLEDGAAPAQIDAAMRGFGFARGPYEDRDRLGLWNAAPPVADTGREVSVAGRMIDAGLVGSSDGQGIYLGDDDGSRVPNQAVLDLLTSLREEKGITARNFSARDIRDRVLLAMVNEGADLVEDGIALRPLDVDIALVRGLGYPEQRGGAMFDADQTGLFEIARRIGTLAREDEGLWRISPLIERLARERGRFSDLN